MTTLYCGFCGKSQEDVRKLIAGPLCFICNECVVLSYDILEAENIAGATREQMKGLGKDFPQVPTEGGDVG